MKLALLLLCIPFVVSSSEKEKVMKLPLKKGRIITHNPRAFYHDDTVTLVTICPGEDTAVRSCFNAQVIAIHKYDREYTVITRMDSVYATYSSLDSVLVTKGQHISSGDPIGVKSHFSQNDSFIVYQIYINSKAVNPRRFIVYE